jgi:hypothetical protein
MVPERALLDAMLSWTGAVGVLHYLVQVRRERQGSQLERRASFLLACLGLLLLVRGFYWLQPGRVLQTATFVPASLLALAMHVFVEGLLRRHLPLAMKAFVALGALVFSVANLAGALFESPAWTLAFLVYTAATLALLAAFLVLRRREQLSPPENRFIDVVVLAVLCALPLWITDFPSVVGIAPIRMGALGALLFVHVCARNASRRDRGPVLLVDVVRLGLRALGLAAVLYVLAGFQAPVPCAAFALAFVLLLATWDRLWMLSQQVDSRSFLRWLAEAETASLEGFLEALKQCPAAEQHVTLREEQLRDYDVRALLARLRARSGALSRSSLRGRTPEAADEQLLALLETHGMSHACLVSSRPPVLLLLNHPGLADGSVTELELALVRKLASLAADHDAAPA